MDHSRNFKVNRSSAGSGKTYTLCLNFIALSLLGSYRYSSDYYRSILAITFTNKEELIIEADVYIVTVPTPIDSEKKPDISELNNASKLIGKTIRKRSKILKSIPIIIFESTVYPGLTEDVCIPIIYWNFAVFVDWLPL